MNAPEPVRRTLEIEDPTNIYVVHPISNRLVPLFARWGVKPNAVSLAGMAFGILAGIAYHFYRDTGAALLGFALMIGWHVMDGVDGQLARLTRTHSDLGKVLDGICDYTTFGAVYIGLALALSRQHGASVFALVAVAGACHAVQSAIYEVQRQNYNFWGRGLQSAAFLAPADRSPRAHLPVHRRIADALLHAYLRIQHVAVGADAEARGRLAAILAQRPEQAADVRQAYRDMFAPVLRWWSMLSANWRTIAIFVFASCGMPVLYFWFEIVVLSGVLAALLWWQRTRYARFFALPAMRN